jgi:hypothetical protein
MLRGTLVGFGDVSEEDGADDTAAAPHESNASVVEFPAVVVGGGTHEHKTLGVGDEFGGVQCLLSVRKIGNDLFEFINESFLVSFE